MANMSYCRFQNTVQDLQECSTALSEMISTGDGNLLSCNEQSAARDLVSTCFEIIETVCSQSGHTVEELVTDETRHPLRLLNDALDELFDSQYDEDEDEKKHKEDD